MSVTAKPPSSSRPVATSPGDVDGLLHAFFRAEMPDPWPAPSVPIAAEEPVTLAALPPRPHSLVRSRWALAASVLVLVLGHAILTRTFPAVTPADPDRDAGPTIGLKPRPETTPVRPPLPPR